MSIENMDGLNNGELLRNGKLQSALLKLVAEQNNEKFLEYDRETDIIVLSEIRDGKFYAIEIVKDFIAKEDMILSRIYEKDKEIYRAAVQKCLGHACSQTFDVRYIIPEVGPRWYRMFLLSVADENGYVTNFVARMVNIQVQKLAQEKMKNEAERDLLSGVYNHATYERICTELAEKRDDGIVYAMVDIDNFKQLNDSRGHHAGDQIIQHVGNVLENAVKGRGYAGRIGGDEFSVCFYDVYTREDAVAKFAAIRSAIQQYVNTVPFTVSVGVTMSKGRKMNFKELYFEADEAVYFAKESGKNQIVFMDEIEKKKEIQFMEKRSEYALSEEEIALDQKIQYVAIVEPIQKRILYVNEAGRNALGLSLGQLQSMCCFELFKTESKECSSCELHANHVEVIESEHCTGLKKYIPDGKFILQSRHVIWKGVSARAITFMNLNDTKHVEKCMEAEMESQDAFSKCWSLIMESNTGDTEYEKILRVLTDYYDADCCAIVIKDDDKYQDVFEYHKSSANIVAESLRVSVIQGIFKDSEQLLDEDDYFRPRHMEDHLRENPQTAETLVRHGVHGLIGMALRKFGEIIGSFVIINPRHHLNDYGLIGQLGVFFAADLIRKKLTDSKSYEADHDVMTRLWSRDFFNNDWQEQYLPYFKGGTGVFTADIYRLKDVNKQLGYAAGNERIIELADMLRKVFTGYSMFRYDDDQVIAICHNVEQRQFQKMVDYAKELIEELDYEVSHGYSWKPEPNLQDAINEAEEYLGIHRQYLEKENASAEKLARKIEKDVNEQIKEGNFRMFLQPKVSIMTGKTVGSEALIRLYHPEKGYISPALFIPVLEQQNEVHLIDMFILSRAFQFQKAAKDAGKEIVPISVNFSKNTLIYPKLMDYIAELCDNYGMPNGMIRIEITETISNMDHMEINTIAKKLRSIGFSISMDDFGTQYSNMAVLTQFEFDTVKIDRSMILNIVDNEKSKLILKHTIAMLKELGMEIVIEGVETKEQVDVLRELGCDTVQGFFFGRPEPEEDFYRLYM